MLLKYNDDEFRLGKDSITFKNDYLQVNIPFSQEQLDSEKEFDYIIVKIIKILKDVREESLLSL